MALRIVTADERLSRAANKTTLALFGPSGVGKTSQLKTLPAPSPMARWRGANSGRPSP
jgi:putative ribosome biogenesis GTPase RsgA